MIKVWRRIVIKTKLQEKDIIVTCMKARTVHTTFYIPDCAVALRLVVPWTDPLRLIPDKVPGPLFSLSFVSIQVEAYCSASQGNCTHNHRTYKYMLELICGSERVSEGGSVRECVWMRERDLKCVWQKERDSVCLCVCACVYGGIWERKRVW